MAKVTQDQHITTSGEEKQGQRKDARGERDGRLEQPQKTGPGNHCIGGAGEGCAATTIEAVVSEGAPQRPRKQWKQVAAATAKAAGLSAFCQWGTVVDKEKLGQRKDDSGERETERGVRRRRVQAW